MSFKINRSFFFSVVQTRMMQANEFAKIFGPFLMVTFVCFVTLMVNQSGPLFIKARTHCGYVVGRVSRVTVDDKRKNVRCTEYLNMPYADPLQLDEKWSKMGMYNQNGSQSCDTYWATISEPKMCKQWYFSNERFDYDGEIDCLRINVRSPNLRGKLPIVVWVHGGNLLKNYGVDQGYSPDAMFAAQMDAVAVSFNYRIDNYGLYTVRKGADTEGLNLDHYYKYLQMYSSKIFPIFETNGI